MAQTVDRQVRAQANNLSHEQRDLQSMNSDCRKCRKPMPPLREPDHPFVIMRLRFRTTGYLCECGHWNDLKSRKGWSKAGDDAIAAAESAS